MRTLFINAITVLWLAGLSPCPAQATATERPDDTAGSTVDTGSSHGVPSLKSTISDIDFETVLLTQIKNETAESTERSGDFQVLKTKQQKLRKAPAKLKNRISDTVDELISIDAFSSSKEAARQSLQEQKESNDLESIEVAITALRAQNHEAIISSILEMAEGLGESNAERGREITERGFDSLAQLVTIEHATETLNLLRTWYKDCKRDVKRTHGWSMRAYRAIVSSSARAAIANDSQVQEIAVKLTKYAHPGRAKTTIASVLESTLSTAAWLSPGFGLPAAAELARVIVVAATGGSEESKLLEVLALQKRLQQRCTTITNELQLALTAYQSAVLQNNSILSDVAKAVVHELASDEQIKSGLSAPAPSTRPPINHEGTPISAQKEDASGK